MNSESVLEDLVAADVLRVTDRTELALSPTVAAAVDEFERDLGEAPDRTVRTTLRSTEVSDAVATRLVDVAEEDPEFVGRYLALVEHLERPSHETVVSAICAFEGIDSGTHDGAGVPEGFLPTSGTRLMSLLEFLPRAVVYVWREDCEPCDYMRDLFEEHRAEIPDDLTLLAVFGPDNSTVLYEELDIGGAPTTVFVVDGQPDSRVIGATPPQTVLAEIETIHEA